MFLSAVIFIPILFAFIIYITPYKSSKLIARMSSFVHVCFSLSLFNHFKVSSQVLQITENIPWIPELGINYSLGLDGISFWFVISTSLLFPFILELVEEIRSKGIYILLLVLQTTTLGAFLATDSLLFFIFFEMSMVSLFFIIGIWGDEDKKSTALQLLIKQALGSFIMLSGIIYLIFQCDIQQGELSASFINFYALDLFFVDGRFITPQNILFFVFCLTFFLRISCFPFHRSFVQALSKGPLVALVLIPSTMISLGIYGFYRFVIPMFPQAISYWGEAFICLGVTAVIYGFLMSFIQVHIKKMLAYSSISIIGLMVIGLFSGERLALFGSLLLMLSYTLSMTCFTMSLKYISPEKTLSKMSDYIGLGKSHPVMTVFLCLSLLSLVSVPLTSGFIAESLILLSVYKVSKIMTLFIALGLAVGFIHIINLVRKIYFGNEKGLLKSNNVNEKIVLKDLIVLGSLVFTLLFVGILPNQIFSYSEKSIERLGGDQ